MADVSERAPRCEDRGQLILITAVGIASMLVLLALLLNSVIYTENLTTRGGQTEHARDAMEYEVEAEQVVTALLERSNRNGWAYAAFRENVTTWNDLSARQSAANGATTYLSINSMTEGSRIAQADADRPLTNASGVETWTLVTGASEVRRWELNVSRSSLVTNTSDANASELVAAKVFSAEVDRDADTWRVFVYTNGTHVLVKVEDETGTLHSCPASTNGTIVVDVVGETVDGAPCSALGFLAGTGSTDVRYNEGRSAAGTYALVVDRPIGAVDDGDFGGAAPSVAPYIYDVTIDLGYRTPHLQYHEKNVPIDPEGSP